MDRVTWLHVSDFHFVASGDEFSQEVAAKALLENVERQAEDYAPVSFVVVTGDVAFSGQREEYERAREFMKIVLPRHINRVKLYDDNEPIFSHYGIEEEILKIQDKNVPLKGGGSLVIEQTEALVAIDVNSGTFRVDDNAEQTAYQVNCKAAREIARQVRLRDLGGVIVNDFIDMRDERHRRGVERELREAVKRDRARTKILRMSQFGLIEMTRQRIRPSLRRSVYEDCESCQ